MSSSGLFFGSLVVAAVGAVLRWGVADSVEGADLATIGLIVLAVGVIGALAGLVQMFAGRRSVTSYQDNTGRSGHVVHQQHDPIA